VLDAVSRFNGPPPNIGNLTLDSLLARNQGYLIRRMATMALLESVGLLQTRNHINYSAGGMSVGVNDKTPLIMRWLEYYGASVAQEMLRVKISMNIEAALGYEGVASELWAVNSTYAAY
jgi:hypothetical protein